MRVSCGRMTSLPETSPPAALPTRPEARTFRVEDLVSSVLAGKIRIPACIMDTWSTQARQLPLAFETRYALEQHHSRLRAAPNALLG